MKPGGGSLGISGWGCAAGTQETLAYTRARLAEFATLCCSKFPIFPQLSTLLRLIHVNLNLRFDFFYFFEWQFLVSLV